MNNLLSWSYWFEQRPIPFQATTLYIVAGIFLLGLILGIVALSRKKGARGLLSQQIWLKLANFGWSFAIVGFILVFLKEQRTPYLGMRIWFAVWLIIALVWLGFILKFMFVEVPKKKQEREKQQEFRKYLR